MIVGENYKDYKGARVRSSGISIVEIAILVVVLIIIAVIALPIFWSAQDKARAASIIKNMRIAQVAAEAYAVDNARMYPGFVDDAYKSYFPGGGGNGLFPAPTGFINPISNAPEFPIPAVVPNVQITRASAPSQTGGLPGQVMYAPQNPPTSYAILGTDRDGRALGAKTPANSTLVFSNQ